MSDSRKNRMRDVDQFHIAIRHQDLEYKYVLRFKIFLKCLKHSNKILLLLSCQKREVDIKNDAQRNMIDDDKYRKLVFIDFICTIHQKNFSVILQELRCMFLYKKQMNNFMRQRNDSIFIISIVSFQIFQKNLH
jgi:hypothetical protein